MFAPRPNALASFGFGLLFGFLGVSRLRPPRPVVSDDPEILLAQAQQEMREAQAKNRERAVQAITQKNNLQNLVEQNQRIISNLWVKAKKARRQGDDALDDQLLAEKAAYELTLTGTTAALRKAEATTESIKTAMRWEEERIRAKTAQALAMKAQWNQVQIETAIHEAHAGIVRPNAAALFRRAEARITQERERLNQIALLEQVRQTAENLSTEAAQARETGNPALAERLTAERDALLDLLPHRPS